LGAILEWNTHASPDAFGAVAEALGCQRNATAVAPAYRSLVEKTGLDCSLANYKIDPKRLAGVMMAEENIAMLENNARQITPDDALNLARRILSL
jgi:alcohol dehydrogenase class IV